MNSLKFTKTQFKELPRTFAVRRDFSLLLNKSVSFAQIDQLARKTEKKLLTDVNLFDVYEGKNLDEGKKSYAVSFTFQDLHFFFYSETFESFSRASVCVCLTKKTNFY